jgi:hypothetical protein
MLGLRRPAFARPLNRNIMMCENGVVKHIAPKKSRTHAPWSPSRLETHESSQTPRLHVGRAQDTQGVSWPPRTIDDIQGVSADVSDAFWGRHVTKVANYSCATRSAVGVLTKSDRMQENDGICRHDSI